MSKKGTLALLSNSGTHQMTLSVSTSLRMRLPFMRRRTMLAHLVTLLRLPMLLTWTQLLSS